MQIKQGVLCVFLVALCGCSFAQDDKTLNAVDGDSFENFGFKSCDDKDGSLSCQGIRIARNVLQQLMKTKSSDALGDLKIIDGVELIRSKNLGDGGRSLNDGTLVGKLAGYLHEHEIRVKLPELLGRDGMNGVFSETLRSFNKQTDMVETGRKKGKGDGGVLLMGLMMAKTLAAIGFGGLGLLTMKALMVSGMALMLSAIIGVKKLASSGGDDGGHQVHYVNAHDHHRKKRSDDGQLDNSPYAGWSEYRNSN